VHRKGLTVLLLILLSLIIGYGVSSENQITTTITVYEDGYAVVETVIALDENTGEDDIITLKLLSPTFENLLVSLDGEALPYKVAGDTLVIDADDAQGIVNIYYETQELTRKEGRYWEIALNLTEYTRLYLPAGSSIVYLSNQPTKIGAENDRPVLEIGEGEWVIGYVLGRRNAEKEKTNNILEIATLSGIAAAIFTGLAFLAITYRSRFVLKRGLSQDEVRVLEFVRARGRVSEAEIRSELALPKTTVWRVVRRLERRGLVKVRKIGNRNEVEPA